MNESPESLPQTAAAEVETAQAPAPAQETSAPATPAQETASIAAETAAEAAQGAVVPAPEEAAASETQSYVSWPARALDGALNISREHPNAVIFGSGVLFALVVLWLVARARKAELGLFRNPSGRVSVSRTALADLVETVARGVPGTVKPRAYFRKRGGVLNVKLRLRLKGRRRLAGFISDLQERISRALRDALGEEQVGQVDIIVTSFYDLGTVEQRDEKDAADSEIDESKGVM